MVYVTHDQVEAMTMADKIVVLNGGVVEQIGSPLDLYHHPRNLFVAGFIGSPAMNFLAGRIAAVTKAGITVKLNGGSHLLVRCQPQAETVEGAPVTLGVRPAPMNVAAA